MKTSIAFEKVYLAQDRILKALSNSKNFSYVLSGGTALSRFYFHHRFSEDLDFFCEEMEFSFGKVEAIINSLRKKHFQCELSGRTDLPGHLKIASYSVIHQESQIKVDFLEDPFSGMWPPVKRKTESGIHFRVDALDQLYYRKLFSLLEQWHRVHEIQRIKDIVDLYILHQHHRSLEKTIRLFRKEHVPVDEEKILLILSSINKKYLADSLKILQCDIKVDSLWKALNKAQENLLRKGLGK